MKLLMLLSICATLLLSGSFDKVKITPEISYIYVYHKGKAVKVHRIQNTKHKITGEYAKIYRPGSSIQPIRMQAKVKTVGEVEVLNFMTQKANKREGVVIDVRPKSAYKKESIPSAVNIPVSIKDDAVKIEKILSILGAKRMPNGTLDTQNAREILVYCDGLWSAKAAEFIKKFLELGYPAEKIYYYRGGFQMWKILGFTTVTNE